VAVRPRTLWIATIPVFVGTSLAWATQREVDVGLALGALVVSVLLQVITNLQNDVGYTARGAESANRVGLPRATARGWLSASQVRTAIVATVVVTFALGMPLVAVRGWPILAMGVASIVAALAYMGGPRPLAYTPFGEFTVFVFFGVVAVAGSYYLQTAGATPLAWVAGVAIGMLAASVLVVNNHRDAAHDRTTGRRTFAVAFGSRASLRLYALLVLAPLALAAVLAAVAGSAWLALPLATAPTAWRLARDLARVPSGARLNALLLRTVMLEVAYGGLLTAGAVALGLS
jgi:1,4-dihydroxy-2-naphthoate octaprenyltransferase